MYFVWWCNFIRNSLLSNEQLLFSFRIFCALDEETPYGASFTNFSIGLYHLRASKVQTFYRQTFNRTPTPSVTWFIAIGSSELIRRHTNFCKLFWKHEGQDPAFVRALDRSPTNQKGPKAFRARFWLPWNSVISSANQLTVWLLDWQFSWSEAFWFV